MSSPVINPNGTLKGKVAVVTGASSPWAVAAVRLRAAASRTLAV